MACQFNFTLLCLRALRRSTLAALPLRARPLGNAAAVLLRLRALRPVLVALALPALLRKHLAADCRVVAPSRISPL